MKSRFVGIARSLERGAFGGKKVLVTGGGSGIGAQLVQQLSERGARVVVADRDVDAAERIAAQFGGEAIELDVTDEKRFEEVAEACSPIDCLINCAGVAIAGEAHLIPARDWRRVIEVNLFGTINGINAVYPRMVRRGQGQIANVASLAGVVPLPGETAYVASKYAVYGLSHALRAEAADLGVSVSVVCPGRVNTPIYNTSQVVGFDQDAVMKKLWPKGITPEAAARTIIKGISKKTATILVAPESRVLYAAQRFSPGLVGWFSKHYIRQARKISGGASQCRTG